MTRRKFIIKLIMTSSAFAMGAINLIWKAEVRKYVRAVRLKMYPGPLRSLEEIWEQGNWKG